ncbi:MAG: nuclear transport factor 2 family protein [Gemmatimonadota bacterium]|nr:nuclear transport factor 2 family protein [Gemmatimonadota bacterium]MDH4348531.1 nuclear transport factor 2 family protein [Gemmatimonadota bacterium]MDH5284895.1 nuclear transport factor 2 family protein [Gemmatimonadota bacterium]
MPLRFCRLLLVALIISLVAADAAHAQAAPDREAILGVVRRLFDGMRAGDSAAVRAVFHPRAAFIGALEREGTASVKFEDPEGFIKAVGSPHEQVWDERTRNEVVHQDGTLASVWMDYSFYLGDKFSHCGVDAFLLARESADWKIVTLADTRRRQGCPDQPGS